MLAKSTVQFLRSLDQNNNRDWFNANKAEFLKANDNVIALAGELINRISRFDKTVEGLDPKTCVFRIYRDVRFSKDKSPYKTNLGAFIAPGGKKAMFPGYYFHIQPRMFFAAAGKHLPNSAELLKIRNAISRKPKDFAKIVTAPKFRQRFGDMDGERLRNPPVGFLAADPLIEFIKLKSFTVSEEFSSSDATSPEYPRMLAESFKSAYPFVSFLRAALS